MPCTMKKNIIIYWEIVSHDKAGNKVVVKAFSKESLAREFALEYSKKHPELLAVTVNREILYSRD